MRSAQDWSLRIFRISQSNQYGVSDTTFIPTRRKWLYLAGTRQFNAALAEGPWAMAILLRGKLNRVIVHSGPGVPLLQELINSY